MKRYLEDHPDDYEPMCVKGDERYGQGLWCVYLHLVSHPFIHRICCHQERGDFGLPLLRNARTTQLFVESLAMKIPTGGLRSYTETEVRS